VIPINRWPVKTLPTQKCWPYQVLSFVEWCGHQQEVVLVPEGGRVVFGGSRAGVAT
jgi:hypothetical protein